MSLVRTLDRPFINKNYMPEIVNLTITQSAALELSRQAAFAGTPGEMFIDLIHDFKDEDWLHIQLRPGTCNGSPISRTAGVTLFANSNKFSLFKGLTLDYYSDLSGGGFLISTPENATRCSCGSGFKLLF
tara:strand:+ start:804 stop:1193 length:390 start_codon:yes stop_codon:yes gene_type:complete